MSIVQVASKYFNMSTLLEKQPVIIEDNAESILDRLRKECMLALRTVMITENQWNINKYKHMVIQVSAPATVLACPATMKRAKDGAPFTDSSIIAFKLIVDQTLVLPFHWSIYAETISDISVYGVHDLITYFMP